MSQDRISVWFGPDAFVLYQGGVRRFAVELLGALRLHGVNAQVLESAERWSRSGNPATSPLGRAWLQVESAARQNVRLSDEGESVVHSLYYDALHHSRKAPNVVTVHDMAHERLARGRILPRLKKRAVARADCLVAISAATAHDLRDFYQEIPRCVVIAPGLSPKILDLPRNPLTMSRPYLLYVGPRGGYKNFSVLVESLPQLAKLGLALVLVGGEELTDRERYELALRLGGADGLLHLRPNDSDLVRLYDGAAAMVVTSRCEGFGLPLLEAMARGCPIATSTGGSLPEVANGMADLFDPESARECAEAISRAMRADRRSLTGATDYARAFTWEKAARLHCELYEELLAR